MARKHYTALGEPIDMASLAMKNATTVALGNAKMNARGDILDPKGIVLKTQEQIEEEWRRNREAREASVGVQDLKQPMPFAAPPGKRLDEDQDFDPVPAAAVERTEAPADGSADRQARRRKIVDAD